MVLDVSKFVGCCKDFLHAEWAVYKKSGIIKPCLVCIYSVGGENDIPASCIDSVGNGFKEVEKVFRETIHLAVDLNTPIVRNDIMVWANGQITLFPPRKAKPLVEPTPSTADLKPGKKARPPPTPEASFMGAIEQIANYMLDHLKRVSESCLLSGNIKALYYVLASALLIKSRSMAYKHVLKAPSTKSLTSAVNRSNEMVEVMTQHLLNYHSDLLRSSILHDAPSHDWNSEKSYEENEKISLSIQMWCFYMQGIRNDLWRYTSNKVGENILNNILVDTLGLLVTRFSQIKCSDMRLPQMKGDINTIFVIAASFMFSLAPSPRHFLRGDIHSSAVYSIHRRMDLLLRIAALKCAPVETIAKVYALGIYPSKRFSVNAKEPTEIESCPSWLTFLNPWLFPPNTRHLAFFENNAAVYLTLHNAAMRPYIDKGLILRGLFMRSFLAAKLLLKTLQDLPGQVKQGQPCNGALCLGHLCSPPLIPHTVYAAIIQIIIESYETPATLVQVLQGAIKNSGNWDSLDRKHVWNIQRAPWHHAFVQCVAIYIAPVIAKVLEIVPAEPPAQPAHPSQLSIRLEHHLSAWTLQLINGVSSMADVIPLSLIYISQTVNDALPPTIKPVGNHVMSQFVVSAIYSIINSRSSLDQLNPCGPITEGQWDMMLAVGERLCSLHDGTYDTALEKMTSSLVQRLSEECDIEEESLDEYTHEEAIEEVSQQMADHVSASVQGNHAFGIIWEYLKRNMGWIGHALNVSLLPPISKSQETPPKSILPAPDTPPKSVPPPRMSFFHLPHIFNPLKYYDKIFFNAINHENLISFEGDWESVLEGDLWLPKYMIHDFIRERPEMQEEAVLTPSQAEAVQKLKALLK